MTCIMATQSPSVLNNVSNGCSGDIKPSYITIYKSFDFYFHDFRNWSKKAESIRRYTGVKTHIMVTDSHRELKLVSNDCLDIVL